LTEITSSLELSKVLMVMCSGELHIKPMTRRWLIEDGLIDKVNNFFNLDKDAYVSAIGYRYVHLHFIKQLLQLTSQHRILFFLI
tara:strand:+ start:221 stop:472 length:252 start_codon:yes stop_codon:yes gene_type:complete